MATVTHGQEVPAFLVIDPYNDLISEGGKVWDRLKTVAEANDCVPHMLQVLNAARKAGLPVRSRRCGVRSPYPSRRTRPVSLVWRNSFYTGVISNVVNAATDSAMADGCAATSSAVDPARSRGQFWRP